MEQKELEEYAAYYLARLGSDAHALDSLTEVDRGIVPILIDAFRSEQSPDRKSWILEAIINYRDPSSMPCLADALNDPVPAVWKVALSGLVLLNRPECAAILEEARSRRFARETDEIYFRYCLDEALDDMQHGFFGESAARARLRADRRAAGQCVVCGQRLTPIQRLLRRERHGGCK